MARRAKRVFNSDEESEESPENVKEEPLTQVINGKTSKDRKGKARQIVEADDGQQVDVDEEYNGNQEISEENEEQQSPNGRKRAKLNGGHAKPVKMESLGVVPLQRDVDGYVLGSIVRIMLLNFVTYDWVEFRPGPYLNMILGPNGTGKSSIACAICIGLGWPPSILGRAPELSAFVKHGCEKGHVEIELKGAPGKPNVIVRREITSLKKHSSTFTLNGEKATAKEVVECVRGLNVQVENLCTFLPQDRVSEFAAMSPQQVLKETQRAAGAPGLSQWHQSLIELGKEQAALVKNLDSEKQELKTLKDRNEILERDVKRYLERKKIERQIELYELILPFREYAEKKSLYDTLKKERGQMGSVLQRALAKNAPIQRYKKALEQQFKNTNTERGRIQDESKAKFQTLRKKTMENERVENEAETFQKQLELLKKNEKERRNRISKLKDDIRRAQETVDNPPEIEDTAPIIEELRQLQAKGNDCERQITLLGCKQREMVPLQVRCQADIDRARKDLSDLDNIRLQQINNLKKWDRDAAEAAEWVHSNQSKFQQEVFEPPCISITVPNQRYANAVESCFSTSQIKTFVTQCKADYDTLTKYVNDSDQALGRKGRINVWFRPFDARSLVDPPMSREDAGQMGFDGFASDFVRGPEGMLWYLQKELALHRTPVALNGSRVDGQLAMDVCSRPIGGHPAPPTTYILGDTICTVSRSRYGDKLPQSATRLANNARNLGGRETDASVKASIQRKIEEAEEAHRQKTKELDVIGAEIAEIRSEHTRIKAEMETSNKRRLAIKGKLEAVEKAKLKLSNLQRQLQTAEDAGSTDEEKLGIAKQLRSSALKRTQIVLDMTELIRTMMKDHAKNTKLGLQALQLSANIKKLDELCKLQDDETRRIQEAFDDVTARFQRAKDDSVASLNAAKEKMESVDQELQQEFNNMREDGSAFEKSIEDINQAIDEAKAKLDLNLHTQPGVIEQYEKRQAEIASLTRRIETKEQNAQVIDERVKNIKDQWYPALKELVTKIGEKFTTAFDSIGCAGEIKIAEHEDYDKWAIDILVKFRDTEKLQLLTGQRQSGGERSLTTIMYLMSLTELAKSPFSLVDEINQGMDARAERLVHNALVKTTCDQDAGQYFLITPKLLTDLTYHKRMKILCVNNGEWLPEERGLGNMNGLIDAYLGSRAGRVR